ncbi:hypothetical protein EF903_01675 [Streptomyces sp. WAC05292]|uniref:hypothetical protein n=1 Tax=Streptomyces sp. WAC05292 TaxID=2487418 RepID=UPI000F736EDE|nr:hypothetical protein [Streptomyces sp. WAC05292]RSS97256.1 hypothetical protein EF903_01675 [Streptomyces sp. WAC05292]
MNFTGHATVSLAPVGTHPDDGDAWTTVGTVTDVQLDNGPNSTPEAGQWEWPAATSVTRPVRLLRAYVPADYFLPKPCLSTWAEIEQHAQRARVGRLLADARSRPALLPCPRPM